MTLYDLKPRFQGLLRPLLKRLVALGVTANQVTSLAMLASVALGVGLCFAPDRRWFALLPVFLFIRMALNAIDGMLAREFKQASKTGAILNEAGDVISDSALIWAFSIWPGVEAWLILLAIVAAFLTELVGVQALSLGASRRYDGPFGKSDRAFVLGALGLLLPFISSLEPWLNAIFAAFALLCAITALNRARRALHESTLAESECAEPAESKKDSSAATDEPSERQIS